MNRIQKFIHNYPQQVAVGVLGFFLFAGFVQAALGLSYVYKLTPIIITAAVCAALVFWEAPLKAKLIASASIVVGGYFVELIGVQTGLVFGDYNYGKVLGFTIFGVPLTIGITWLMVTLSAWNIVNINKYSLLQRFLLGGVLVVMFDLLLEQFAAAYGLWAWYGANIPLYNYLCWFILSLVCFYIFHKLTPKIQPSFFAICLLPLMAIFFWLMLLIA